VNTTFDRYLIIRYLQIFVILFVSVFGLFVVIDGFSNVDEFQEHGQSTLALLGRMGSYYAYQSTMFLDMCGPLLTVIDAMIVFALLLRNSELQPILAAGVPTWRLLLPVVISTAVVNGLMTANQELIIPRIADVLQTPRDSLMKGSIEIEPLTDPSSGIHIDGQHLSLNPQMIEHAQFVLPRGEVAQEMTTVNAAEAVYYPAKNGNPSGWRLKNVETPYSQLGLTNAGRKLVLALENPKELFIVSELSFDLLYNRLQSSKLISTPELIHRLRSPAFGQSTARMSQHLHARITRPIANILCALLAVPLILRKESRALITNMALSSGTLIGMLAVAEAAAYGGRSGAISPELAAWIPIISTGTLFTWLTGLMQT
jgi:lipopolysaccharide export system permease protein